MDTLTFACRTPAQMAIDREAHHEIVMRLHRTSRSQVAERIIESGTLEQVREGIADGMYIGGKDLILNSMLRRRMDVAQALLDAGAPVNSKATEYAARINEVNFLEKLLKVSGGCDDAFHSALVNHHWDSMRAMLPYKPRFQIEEAFARVDNENLLTALVKMREEWTAHARHEDLVLQAIKHGNLTGVRVAQKMGVQLDRLSFSLFLEVDSAEFQLKRADFLEGVIALGARPLREEDGGHLLFRVLNWGSGNTPDDVGRRVKALLDLGYDPGRACSRGDFPIHRACHRKTLDAIPLLLDAGARQVQRAYNGNTALMEALLGSEPDVFNVLVQSALKKEPQALLMCNEKGEGLMQQAAAFSRSRPEVAMYTFKVMLDAGMDPDLPDANGQSARMVAARHNQSLMLALMDSHLAKSAIDEMENQFKQIKPLPRIS